jgi:hypothetical protein
MLSGFSTLTSRLSWVEVPGPWFPAYSFTRSANQELTWFSALVPPEAIAELVTHTSRWDFFVGDGRPDILTTYPGGQEQHSYAAFGNGMGIEPLVIVRSFHGLRDSFPELAQEFRLYYNLYPEPSKKRFLLIDNNGDESEAARYGDDFLEIRTDLVLKFCAVKQMALAIYVNSFRYSKYTLEELGFEDTETNHSGPRHEYFLAVVAPSIALEEEFKTRGRILGKKYILPGSMPTAKDEKAEIYQEFTIGTDNSGRPIRHTCAPGKLAGDPQYLTPVFFRAEVLSKYYDDPRKYSVEDGYLRCGSLWGLQIDNDHTDYVVVFLGDLGRDLSEAERNYWLSFNIAPQGRRISQTAVKRSFWAEFTDPAKPDLVFKDEYKRFNCAFRESRGWDFFLPLHDDDKHFLTGLRLLSQDNQAEFDSQLIALTKLLVDSLNESAIAKDLLTVASDDKGITKLEKFFKERNVVGYEPHVKFLRVLQEWRSRSAAHRKGSNYDKLIADFEMFDEGQQRVFAKLLGDGIDLIRYLGATLLPKSTV